MNPISILRDTWYFFSRHVGTLLPLCLPWIVLETLTQQQLSMAANSQQFAPWGMAAGLVFYPIYSASLLLYLIDFGEGRQRGIGELWRAALRLWPAFALLSALSSLLIVIGLSLMVIPGIYVMIKLAFAEVLLVKRGLRPIDAMRESFRLTGGHFFLLLSTLLVILAPTWALQGWIEDLRDGSLGYSLALSAISGFFQLLLTVVAYRIYILGPEREEA
ncbi:YciC family protein [Pseudomonas citronellolis]|uniref:YciC family protein n=1 Tax=Pseudomonas citronellolis TaxID=53408 RepID=UPI0023E40D93|nr:YciC family protein [Pseudomonas citronellolis]MDF3933139.1 YciC family protein [Pseudomonas citronellolis]